MRRYRGLQEGTHTLNMLFLKRDFLEVPLRVLLTIALFELE